MTSNSLQGFTTTVLACLKVLLLLMPIMVAPVVSGGTKHLDGNEMRLREGGSQMLRIEASSPYWLGEKLLNLNDGSSNKTLLENLDLIGSGKAGLNGS